MSEPPADKAPEFASGRAPNLVGIVCVMGAVTAFTTQDMTGKWLSESYPLHQITLFRAAIAMAIIVGVFMPLEGGWRHLRTRRPGLHLLRGFAVVVANMCFFTGLVTLPLGEATAIFFVAPLLITALSVVFLGEQVGARRWLAVLVGLTGVVVMMRPGTETFQLAALLPLAAALAYASLQIMTRTLGMAEKASTMSFYIQIVFIAVSTTIGLIVGDGRYVSGDAHLDFLLRAWSWPDLPGLGVLLVIGVLSAIGSYLVSQAYRISEAALVAPFEYVAIPMAVFWSALVWGDWPDAIAWSGIALIGGAGLYVFYRETVRGRLNALRRPMPRNR